MFDSPLDETALGYTTPGIPYGIEPCSADSIEPQWVRADDYPLRRRKTKEQWRK